MKTILLVEDDIALSNGIMLSLKGPEFAIRQAFCLDDAKKQLSGADLILIDVNLPDGSGLDFCREIKTQSSVPVIFLTANDLESDIVTGLELGADDYITKPFSLAVLRARVNVCLRRSDKDNEMIIGPFRFDFHNMMFYKNEISIELSKTEQKLLNLLVSNANHTVTRDRLIDCIWTNGAAFVDENALSVSINRLRNKLEDNPQKPKFIKTVYGIGYQWDCQEVCL